jgi:hypothetical protein
MPPRQENFEDSGTTSRRSLRFAELMFIKLLLLRSLFLLTRAIRA